MRKGSQKFDKYAYYESAVQTPDAHAVTFALMYSEITGKKATLLREDFCGTFRISCEWVKMDSKHFALCLDIDDEPLDYGKKHHLKPLSSSQKKRIIQKQESVLSITSPKAHVIAACNFSFNIFKTRKSLLKYFRNALLSLDKTGGILVLELAGGPGMIETTKEQKTMHSKTLGKYTYIWDQKSFDPITHHANYAIHFKLGKNRMFKDVFTYDWRIWTIPEVRDLMIEAGFKKTHVYWEREDTNGKGTEEFIRTEKGDNAYSWGAYVVGEK